MWISNVEYKCLKAINSTLEQENEKLRSERDFLMRHDSLELYNMRTECAHLQDELKQLRKQENKELEAYKKQCLETMHLMMMQGNPELAKVAHDEYERLTNKR